MFAYWFSEAWRGLRRLGGALTGLGPCSRSRKGHFAGLDRQARTLERPNTSQDCPQRSQEQPRTAH